MTEFSPFDFFVELPFEFVIREMNNMPHVGDNGVYSLFALGKGFKGCAIIAFDPFRGLDMAGIDNAAQKLRTTLSALDIELLGMEGQP